MPIVLRFLVGEGAQKWAQSRGIDFRGALEESDKVTCPLVLLIEHNLLLFEYLHMSPFVYSITFLC